MGKGRAVARSTAEIVAQVAVWLSVALLFVLVPLVFLAPLLAFGLASVVGVLAIVGYVMAWTARGAAVENSPTADRLDTLKMAALFEIGAVVAAFVVATVIVVWLG